MLVFMTTLHERTSPSSIKTPGKFSQELTEGEALPSMHWPFSETTMKHPFTAVVPSYSAIGPQLTIRTPPEADSVLSPVAGRIETIQQPDKTSKVILLSGDSRLVIVLENLHAVTALQLPLKENEPADPDSLRIVNADDPIGRVGEFPNNSINVQVAQLTQDPITLSTNWQLLDPLGLFPPLED